MMMMMMMNLHVNSDDCVQVSEVDSDDNVLHSFTDVLWPHHLSLHSEGHVLVADCHNNRVLLLNSQLQLQRVFNSTNAQVKLSRPERLCYNELTSQLYVVHGGSESRWSRFHQVSLFDLRQLMDLTAAADLKTV